MTWFEKINSSLQTLILFLGLLIALGIGLRQNEINQNLLNLQSFPSPEIAYDEMASQIRIFNHGQSNFWLWGSGFDKESPTIEQNGRLITPGGFYYIPGDKFSGEISKRLDLRSPIRVPVKFFIESSNGRKYQLQCEAFCERKEGSIKVHFQTLAVVPLEWNR